MSEKKSMDTTRILFDCSIDFSDELKKDVANLFNKFMSEYIDKETSEGLFRDKIVKSILFINDLFGAYHHKTYTIKPRERYAIVSTQIISGLVGAIVSSVPDDKCSEFLDAFLIHIRSTVERELKDSNLEEL